MRKVVLYQLLSLDGVAEEPGDWMTDGGEEVFANLAEVLSTQEAVLLGRGTYDYWVDFWPRSDLQPFADYVNGSPKYVFTSTPPATAWENSVVVAEPAEGYVAELKRGTGGDLGVHGSIRLARSLLRADLVDELRLVVSPVVADNGGLRLFDGVGERRGFALRSASSSPGGALFLHYGRAGA